VRPLVAIFLSIFGDFDVLESRDIVFHSMTLVKDRHYSLYNSTSSRQRRPANLIFGPNPSHSWAKLGIAWLFQRDLDYMGLNPVSTKKTDINEYIRPVPMYDVVQAVISGSSRDNLLAHHCLQPIVQCNKSDGSYMWYLSHLVDNWDLDSDRADTLSVDALMRHNTLSFHSRMGSEHLDGVRTSVHQLFMNTTRAMFANGAIRLDDIWTRNDSPLRHWYADEVPGMCMVYTLFNRISN